MGILLTRMRSWPKEMEGILDRRLNESTKARTDLEVIEEAKRIKSAMALRGGRETREISTLYGRQEERHHAPVLIMIVAKSDNLDLWQASALVRGFASRCSVVGARGGKEVALHLERRGGEPPRPCLPIPPQGAEC